MHGSHDRIANDDESVRGYGQSGGRSRSIAISKSYAGPPRVGDRWTRTAVTRRGWVEGVFEGQWKGDVLYGSNGAVNGHYILGWSR